MVYTPDYSEGDLSSSIVDIIVKVILTIGTFITIIMLVLIYNFLKKKVR